MRTGLSFIAVLAAALAVVAVSPAEPGQISSKRAKAERVLAEIDVIDMELDRAVEAYNGATVQLETINRDLAANQKRLVTARANLAAAHKRVANRVLALYTSQEPDALAVLLGASSFGDLIERIDSVNRISKDDVRIAEDVTRFRNEVRTRQGHLVQAQARQRTIVAQRAARRSAIEGQLAERQTLLASIKDEISKLQAAEQARQETLAREARAQLRSTQTQTSGQQQSRGGASPSGFDCSGFLVYVFAKVGVYLPHSSYMQFRLGRFVPRSALQPGDAVFFNGASHVGIYIGSGRFVHAPHTGDVVKISSLGEGWYGSTYVGARRY